MKAVTFFLLGFLGFYLALGAAHARDTYVGVYGGANFDDVLTHPAVNTQRGFVVGGVVGTDVPAVPGLYVEADLSARLNQVNVGPFKADHETTAVLANVIYNIPIEIGPVKPYALLGAGYAHTDATFENIALLKLEASGFAWQGGGGLSVRVADGVAAGLGYKYLQGPSFEVFGTELSDGSNHAVLAEMRIAL